VGLAKLEQQRPRSVFGTSPTTELAKGGRGIEEEEEEEEEEVCVRADRGTVRPRLDHPPFLDSLSALTPPPK
jgi:hypothetical protein